MRYLAAVILVLTIAGGVHAKMVTKTVAYKQNGTVCKGFLVYDDAWTGKRPGVLVVPEWWGLNDFARERAEKLARMGYVALAADMYGDGLTTKDPQEAAKLAGQVRGTPLMRERALAALKALAAQPLVDPKRLAAIGFCFGGTAVLELAYAGADLAGVVSFHGGLTLPSAADLKRIKAKILVLHGADDPLVPPKDAAAFREAMRKAGADWQMVYYGGAVHSFTNPASGSDKSKGVAYNAEAAARSWEAMQAFFKEIFAEGKGK